MLIVPADGESMENVIISDSRVLGEQADPRKESLPGGRSEADDFEVAP